MCVIYTYSYVCMFVFFAWVLNISTLLVWTWQRLDFEKFFLIRATTSQWLPAELITEQCAHTHTHSCTINVYRRNLLSLCQSNSHSLINSLAFLHRLRGSTFFCLLFKLVFVFICVIAFVCFSQLNFDICCLTFARQISLRAQLLLSRGASAEI